MNLKYRTAVYKSFGLITVLLALMTSCGNRLNLPTMDEVAAATIREYSNGTPVSREIALDTEGYGIIRNFIFNGSHFVATKSQPVDDVPRVEKSFQIRLKLLSGEERTFYSYATATRDKEYIEEPYVGIYKNRNSYRFYLGLAARTSFRAETFYYASLSDAFLRNDSISLSILPEYNGSNKALYLEFLSGKEQNSEKEKNPFSMPYRYIPVKRQAERAEDVRYIVVSHVTATYRGYWYDPRTGEKKSDAYAYDYEMKILDLLKNESTYLDNVGEENLASTLEEYFSQVE